MKKDSKKSFRRICYYGILIVLLLAFIISFSRIANIHLFKGESNSISSEDAKNNQDSTNDDYSHLFSADIDLEEKRKEYDNQDIVARLEIPDLFNLLIVKTTDNKYYLNHSISKAKDVRGTEFMDYRVNPSSRQINIYGHNSRTYDVPFRKLENYLDKTFYDEHPYILLQSDEGRRVYQIFSIKEISNDNKEHMKVSIDETNVVEHIEKLKEDSIYSTDVNYDKDSNLLVLQTCSYDTDSVKTYYVISAIEIAQNEER